MTDFSIPESNMPKALDKLAKLARRAAKLGVDAPRFIAGAPYDVERVSETGDRYLVSYVDVTLVFPADVRLPGGWHFRGTIEHGADDTGAPMNLLRAVPGVALPASFRTDPPTCDHCRTNRRRSETFVVEDEAGEMRRVGRQCIADYLGGQTAEHILAVAGFLADAMRILNEEGGGGRGDRGGEWRFGAEEVLAYTAVAVRHFGWVSKKAAYESADTLEATANIVWGWLTYPLRRHSRDEPRPPAVEDGDREAAAKTLEWVRAIPLDTESDYLYNLRVVFSRGSVGGREIGLASSALASWRRTLPPAEAAPSAYLGKVGDRFGGAAKSKKAPAPPPALRATILRRFEKLGDYGVTTIFTFAATAADGTTGDVVWFASGEFAAKYDVGAVVTLTGTVKRHEPDRRTGRPTTYITRGELSSGGAL